MKKLNLNYTKEEEVKEDDKEIIDPESDGLS